MAQPAHTNLLADAIQVIRDVEWSGQTDRAEGGFEPACPHCGNARRLGHQPVCTLAAALAEADRRDDAARHASMTGGW